MAIQLHVTYILLTKFYLQFLSWGPNLLNMLEFKNHKGPATCRKSKVKKMSLPPKIILNY